MSNRTPTPSVPCAVLQSGTPQASPCHDVVKPTYLWPITSSRTLNKPCYHGVFNAVVTVSHHMAKVLNFARANMTQQLFVGVRRCVHLFSGHQFRPGDLQ